MAAFRKNSWLLLMVLYGAKTALDVTSMVTTGASFFAAGRAGANSLYMYLVIMVIYLLLNYWYYKKREALFDK